MPTDYTLMDATLEIILMLLAAFLLGWLFCKLVKKLFGSKPKTSTKQNINLDEVTTSKPEPTRIISSNRTRVYNANTGLNTNVDVDLSASEINIPEINLSEVDLPKPTAIEAPNLDIDKPKLYKQASTKPRPRIDLPDFSTPDADIKGKLNTRIDMGKVTLGTSLGAAAAGLSAVGVGASSFKDKTADKVESLKQNVDIDLPKITTADLESKIDLPEMVTDIAASTGLNLDDRLTQPGLPSASHNSEKVVGGRLDQVSSTSDDLSRISGINEQVVRVLNDRGIHSYKDLQAAKRTRLKEYLDSTGDSKLREIEPASWPHQATLCVNRNWSKLTEYQSFLSGSNLGVRQSTPSYPSTDGDDLKKIEGIGPFFESLLNDTGITSFEQLKNSDRDTLKEIIDTAGPDYRMHEPETWPYQAGLAHRGEWKKLQDYIQFMTGRD